MNRQHDDPRASAMGRSPHSVFHVPGSIRDTVVEIIIVRGAHVDSVLRAAESLMLPWTLVSNEANVPSATSVTYTFCNAQEVMDAAGACSVIGGQESRVDGDTLPGSSSQSIVGGSSEIILGGCPTITPGFIFGDCPTIPGATPEFILRICPYIPGARDYLLHRPHNRATS